MSIKKVFVSSDTTDLKNASKSTADAILANVTTKVHLNADQGATMKDRNEEVFTSSGTKTVMRNRLSFTQPKKLPIFPRSTMRRTWS